MKVITTSHLRNEFRLLLTALSMGLFAFALTTGVNAAAATEYQAPRSNYYSLPDAWNMASCEKIVVGGSDDVLNTSLPIYRCAGGKSSRNSTLSCNKDWTAAYAETASVLDFPLLQFLSAVSPQGTEDNSVQPQCYYDILNNSTKEKNDYILMNYSNDFPGLLQLKGGDKSANLSFPRLGTAAVCGAVDNGNVNHPLKLDIQSFNQDMPQIPDKVSSQGKDDFFSWIFNLLKSINIFSESVKSKEAQNLESVKSVLNKVGIQRDSVCDTGVGKPITSLNKSDVITPTPALSEFVVNKKDEIMNFTNTELCDLNFINGIVTGASCTFNSVGTFSGPKEATVNGTGLVTRYEVPDPPGFTGPTHSPVYLCKNDSCHFDGSCSTSLATLYQLCRAAFSQVDFADGNPLYKLDVPGFDTLTIQGANMTLFNTVNVLEQVNGPYDIHYGENIGIKMDLTRRLYDLNSKSEDYFGNVNLDEGADFDPLKVKTPLRDYISYTKTPYNYNYDTTKLSFSKVAENRSQFYFPYLGKLPYMLERLATIHSNTLNSETSYTMTQQYKSVAGDLTKRSDNSGVLGLSSSVSSEVYKPQLKMCADLTPEEKNVTDCYGDRSDDPIRKYMCDQGLQTVGCQCKDPGGGGDGGGGGTCTGEESIAGKVAWPIAETLNHGGGAGHPGVDFGVPIGTPAYAVAGGTVLYVRDGLDYHCNPMPPPAGMGYDYCNQTYNSMTYTTFDPVYGYWWGGYGNMVVIKHTDGIVIYGHLNKGSITVKQGDCVSRNDQIAETDDVGNSTGPHLHFEMRKLGANCFTYDSMSCIYNPEGSISNLDLGLSSPRNKTGSGANTPSSNSSTTNNNDTYCTDTNIKNTGDYNGTDLLCIFKTAADTANTPDFKIIPEIIYGIAKHESAGLICPLTWTGWRDGERTACDQGANQLAFTSPNLTACCGVDIRGLTQFSNETFDGIISKHKTEMEACVRAVGVNFDNPDPASKDPLVNNQPFSRYRVGDAICATTFAIIDYAKAGIGRQLTEAEWSNLSGIGGEAMDAASITYYYGHFEPNCGRDYTTYCLPARNYAKYAQDNKLFANLNCSSTNGQNP